MREIFVDKKHDRKLLSSFLLNSFSGLSINTFYKALRKKDIRINDVKVNEDVVVHLGDNIKIYVVDELLYRKTIIPDIIYEDEYILVANKPAGIEVLGEDSFTSCIKTFICSREKHNHSKNISETFLEPCHRLDRNTFGLILFAKDSRALSILLDKFKKHEIEKHYLAKVYGVPQNKHQTLNAYLFKDSKKSMVYISDTPQKGYVKISTSYSLIEKNKEKNYSILDITLHTGKTHQIRAHLAHIGYPIIGDGKYGINQINRKFGYKTQQLCSYSLKFCFSSNSDILNYLNNKKIVLANYSF